MKKLFFIYIFILFASQKVNAVNDTLFVYFLENYPYSYTENSVIKGLEVEILKEFIKWEKTDGIDLIPVYKSFSEFDLLLDAVKNGKNNVMGLGSVTINMERLRNVSFSPPYLKNVSVLISDGRVATMKSKNELATVLANQRAVTLKNSVYEKYLNDLKKHSLPKLLINFTDSDLSCIDSVANNKNVFAYCDILSYWTYTRNHKDKFIKIQKAFTFDHDDLGFIIPKNSKHKNELSEFFETGFGFIASKKYQQILEEYLSYEVIESVKIN